MKQNVLVLCVVLICIGLEAKDAALRCPACSGTTYKVVSGPRTHSGWRAPDGTNFINQSTITLKCRTGRCTNLFYIEQIKTNAPNTVIPPSRKVKSTPVKPAKS